MNSISYRKRERTLSEGAILLWIQDHLRCHILTTVLVNITRLGNHGFIWIVIASLLLLNRQTQSASLLSFSALIGSMLINNLLIKRFVSRIRPYEVIPDLCLLIEKEKDFSFPSGHTGCAFSMATVLYCCFPQGWGIYVLCFALLMGLSRLYVGAHYPSDVLAGAAIGSFIGSLIFLFFKLPLTSLIHMVENLLIL